MRSVVMGMRAEGGWVSLSGGDAEGFTAASNLHPNHRPSPKINESEIKREASYCGQTPNLAMVVENPKHGMSNPAQREVRGGSNGSATCGGWRLLSADQVTTDINFIEFVVRHQI